MFPKLNSSKTVMQSRSHHLASVLASLVRCCWTGEPASVCHFGSVHDLSPSTHTSAAYLRTSKTSQASLPKGPSVCFDKLTKCPLVAVPDSVTDTLPSEGGACEANTKQQDTNRHAATCVHIHFTNRYLTLCQSFAKCFYIIIKKFHMLMIYNHF